MSIFFLVAAILIIIGMALGGGNGQHSIKRRINSSRDDSSADFMFYDHMTSDNHSSHNDFHNYDGGYDSCHDSGCDCDGSSDSGCGGDGGCDCGGGGCD